MAHSWSKENGWQTCIVDDDEIRQSYKIREVRDKMYGNIFEPEDSDWRWVGDLGEILFAKFLDRIGIEYTWIQEDVAGKPDFLLVKSKKHRFNNVSVDVKTVKRKGPYLPGYQAQVHAKHKEENVDQFFFMSYEFPLNKMWFIGGAEKEFYFAKAPYYPTGSKIHAQYSTRQKNHNIYNIYEKDLKKPKDWIFSLAKKG